MFRICSMKTVAMAVYNNKDYFFGLSQAKVTAFKNSLLFIMYLIKSRKEQLVVAIHLMQST